MPQQSDEQIQPSLLIPLLIPHDQEAVWAQFTRECPDAALKLQELITRGRLAAQRRRQAEILRTVASLKPGDIIYAVFRMTSLYCEGDLEVVAVDRGRITARTLIRSGDEENGQTVVCLAPEIRKLRLLQPAHLRTNLEPPAAAGRVEQGGLHG